MGDAVKIFHKSKLFNNISDILLIWSDIPYISRKSIDIMLNKHFMENNFYDNFKLLYKKSIYFDY